jgi:hypothetical protein
MQLNRSVTFKILGDGRQARAEMDWINKEREKLSKSKTTVHIDADTPEAKLTALEAKLKTLKDLHTKLTIDADDRPSLLAAARIEQSFLKLDKIFIKPKISTDQLAKAKTEIASVDLAFGRLQQSVESFSKEADKQNTRLTKFFTPGGGFGRFGALFGGKVALFGGLAGGIGLLHLAVDVGAEILAVWIPAAVAITAFGVAASDAAREVYTHMNNLHLVMDATGKTIKPMTGNMEKLHDAVRPAVYQIFGDALTIMNAKTGIFQKLVIGTSGVLTHLAARMTVAISSGKGFGEFLKNAVPDVAKLGDSFGNLFGILGNLLHVMPGYANILLNFGDGFLRLAEWVSKVAEPLIGAGLWIHGFIVWAGLGASAAFFMGRAIIFVGNTAIGAAVKSFGIFIARLVVMAATQGIATAATFAFGAALNVISANPLIWVGAAIGALAGLAFWLSRSKDDVTKWGNNLQTTIDNASSVTEGLKLTQESLAAVNSRLNSEFNKQASIQKYLTVYNVRTGESTKILSQAYRDSVDVIGHLTEQQRRFNAEQLFSQNRLNGLSKAYGGQKNAMALLNAAGVTEQEWQQQNAEGWAIITQKINGTLNGYKAMGQRAGTLGNDLQVMDLQLTDQAAAMQKLNQAWDQFIGNMTQTQSTFDTSVQGIQTLSTAFDKANKGATKVSVEVGKIKDKFVLVRAPIDSLSKSGIALNQAFTEQVGNTNAMIDTWRTAGIASTMFTRGVKDSIAPLVRYARGSQEATAQLIGLAEEAGYKGPVSLKNLVKWLGNTHDATRTVKNIAGQATIQEGLLTGAMRDQGKYMSGQLQRDLEEATLKYGGVRDAVDAYGKAIARSGVHSREANVAEAAMNRTLIDTMHRAGDSKLAIAEMIAKMDKIPLKKAIQIVETGLGHFSIKDQGKFFLGTASPPGTFHAQRGMKVPGFGGGDKWPALLEGGEAVVPKHLTPAVAPFLAANGVPGFANGVILAGNKGVLTGQAPVNFDARFTKSFTGAMEKAMFEAMKKAMMGSGSGAAIAKYAQTFATGNNHPYVWGGMTPSGWDCSGFTSFIYKHFGYSLPRTSEAQYGWGQRSADQPGALVFFNSPAGGPPPGHVGISMGNGRMANAAATGIGTIMSSSGGNMGFRIPAGGFRGGAGGGAFGGSVRENQLSSLWIAAGGPRNMAHLMAAIAMAESGGRAGAHNPSGASGLWQILGDPFPGNPFDAFTNARMAVAKWREQGLGAWSTYTNGAYRQFLANGTSSARRGWAWVGERGPELVHMQGGETVLDNATSMRVGGGISDGFWKGTVGQAVRGLRNHGYIVDKGGLPSGATAVHPAHEPWHDMASLARAHGWSIGDTASGSGSGSGSGGSGSSGGGSSLSNREKAGISIAGMIGRLSLKSADSTFEKDSREYLKVIAKYFSGPDARRREESAARQLNEMRNIRDRLTMNKQEISRLYADKRSIQQNLSGYGALSGLSIGPTAGIGDNVALSGGQGLKMQLTTRIHTMRQFGNALKKLHRMGLKGSLFRQIVDMGPDQGLDYANELISGGSAFIRQFSAEEGQLNKEERRIAKGASSVEAGLGWKTGKQFYQGLFSQREHLRRLFKELGRDLGEEAIRWFHVPRGRRPKGFATGGILREPVWGMGASGQEYMFGEAGAEFFAPMQSHHTPVSSPGGDTFNVYVNGDTDPDAAARRIIQKLRDYKRKHGNQDTGIG